MESWYICDEDNDDHIGPMVFDELVARTWEGSITPDARVYHSSVTTGWQAARDVAVVGPLLEAVAAGRPSGCHWQRLRRRHADGALWRHINRPQPFAVGCVVYFFVWLLLSGSTIVRPGIVSDWLGLGDMVQPRFSLPWCAAVAANCALACILGLLTQIKWYFISDVVRDRIARSAARISASEAKPDEEDTAIFVYELTPEVRRKLTEFEAVIASPTHDYAIAPTVAHDAAANASSFDS